MGGFKGGAKSHEAEMQVLLEAGEAQKQVPTETWEGTGPAEPLA